MAAGRRTGQSPRVARLGRPLQGHRQPAPARPVRRVAGGARRAARRRRARGRGAGGRGRRRRPPAADLHLLPSRPAAGRPGGADAARGVRPHDRGDRARLPQRPDGGGPANRARQGEDPGRAHPLSGAGASRPAGPARHGAPRDLPGVQRGILRVLRRLADAARSLGRGDPAGTAPDRAAAGARGGGAPGADAAPRIAARRADLAGRRAGPAGRTRTARSGTRRRSRRARRWWDARSRSRRFGPYTLQAAIAAVHAAGARPPPRRIGPRSSACTTC